MGWVVRSVSKKGGGRIRVMDSEGWVTIKWFCVVQEV